MDYGTNESLADRKQRLEEEVETTRAALEKEEKARKELEALNSKLLQEKQQLLSSLEGEKGELSSISERAAKLQAQKNDLDLQLQVSGTLIFSSAGACAVHREREACSWVKEFGLLNYRSSFFDSEMVHSCFWFMGFGIKL